MQNITNPVKGVKGLNFQIAYSLSRFENSGGAAVAGTAVDNDQDFVIPAPDYNKPNRYFGPSLLDRAHQFSFGGFADLPFKFRLGMIGHFYSPLSSTLLMPNSGTGAGEIFRTDFTGDGSVGDPLPGTHLGQFDRGTSASNLNSMLNGYNSKFGNQPTPAGQVLIANGLMSLTQLQQLGGVAPLFVSNPVAQCGGPGQPLNCSALAPNGQVNFSWLRAFDLNFAWKLTIKEKVSIEPSVAVFNLFNFSNFNLPPNTMSGLLTGTPGAINGTTRLDNEAFRVGNGTGVYAVGAARQVEWGMKLTF